MTSGKGKVKLGEVKAPYSNVRVELGDVLLGGVVAQSCDVRRRLSSVK